MSNPGPNIFRLVVGIVACANWLVFDSLAQSYPVRPIRILVGFTSGSAPDVIARLNALIVKIGAPPEMKATLNKQGMESETNTPEQFAALIHRGIELNTKLIKLAGVKPE